MLGAKPKKTHSLNKNSMEKFAGKWYKLEQQDNVLSCRNGAWATNRSANICDNFGRRCSRCMSQNNEKKIYK